MVVNIHSNASYLSEAKARSQTCGHFFMGWQPKDGKPICLNNAFHVSANILRFVVASAAKAELGALYHNCQTGIIFQQTFKAMGHMQPKTPVHCNNATTVGIANNTVKRQRLRSMEMCYFRICTHSAGILAKRTWLITKVSITQAPIMWLFVLGTYTWIITPEYSRGPYCPAL
jgi:hypothetical protein